MYGNTVAVIGGTGHLGHALARRWAQAGIAVVIGSRDPERAQTVAAALVAETGSGVQGDSNRNAAMRGDTVVVAVPFGSQGDVMEEIRDAVKGKIVVDATVPLVPPRVMRVQLPAEGCAAVRSQQLLGDDVQVVAAFHNVAAHRLATDDNVDCDILVFGEDREARSHVIELVNAARLRGLHAGSLANAAAAEALTSVLIFINKHYKVYGAGLRITGQFQTD